jgi:hypothetical protein
MVPVFAKFTSVFFHMFSGPYLILDNFERRSRKCEQRRLSLRGGLQGYLCSRTHTCRNNLSSRADLAGDRDRDRGLYGSCHALFCQTLLCACLIEQKSYQVRTLFFKYTSMRCAFMRFLFCFHSMSLSHAYMHAALHVSC